MGVIESISATYTTFVATLPIWGQKIIGLFLLIILVVIYAIFVWKFYRFIARKNIFNLNLNQYNRSEHPVFSKILAGFLYLIEYLIIMPIIILIWFGVFTIFLILLTETIELETIILTSAIIVGAVRMISYIPKYGENLAKDVAKLLPLTLLAVYVTRGFFKFTHVIDQINSIPTFLGQILLYLLFIVFIEVIMRIFDFISSFFYSEDVREKEDD